MNNKKSLLWGLVGLAVIVIGIAGAYVYNEERQRRLSQPQTATQETAPAGSERTDRVAAPTQTQDGAAPKQERPGAQTETAEESTGGDALQQSAFVLPKFDLLRVEPDGSAVIAGKAEPGATVEVVSEGNVLADSEVGASGDFAAVFDDPLPPGDYQIVLRVVEEGDVVAESDEVATVSVPPKEDPGSLFVMVTKPGEASRIIERPEPTETEPTSVPAVTTEGEAVAERTVDEEPVAGQTVVGQITTEEPVAEETVAERTVTEGPVADQTVVEQTTTEEPMAEETVAERTVTKEPLADQTVVERVTTEEPMAEETVAERTKTEEPVADETVAERSVTEEPVSEETVVEEPLAVASLEERRDRPSGEIDIRSSETDGDGTPRAIEAASDAEPEPETRSPEALSEQQEPMPATAEEVSPDTSNRLASVAPAGGADTVAAAPNRLTPPDFNLRIDAVEIENGRIYVAGSATVGGLVRVFVDGDEIGSNRVSPTGRFLVEADREIAVGRHVISADLILPDGIRTVMRVAVPFTRPAGELAAAVAPPRNDHAGSTTIANGDETAIERTPNLPQTGQPAATAPDGGNAETTQTENRPAGTTGMAQSPDNGAAEIGQTAVLDSTEPLTVVQEALEPRDSSVIIRRGDTLWHISRRIYGRGVRYTTIYLANTDQIQDPHWIEPGQIFAVPEEPVGNAEEIHRRLLREFE